MLVLLMRFKKLQINQDVNQIKYGLRREFYNSSVKKSLKDNDIEMYLIDNEGKSAVAEIFIRTLKNKTTNI